MEVSVLENLRPLRHAPLDHRPHLLDVRRERKFKRGAQQHTNESIGFLLCGWVGGCV